jgi:hypothetical protein
MAISSASSDNRSASNGASVVYIAGFARSGSTLLGDLLGTRASFFHAGEIVRLGLRLARGVGCSCGASFRTCNIWGQVLKEIQIPPQIDKHWSDRYWNSDGKSSNPLLAARLLGDIYGTLAKVTGSSVIVDSSKVPRFARLLAAESYAVVHLVRDSRAAVYSRLRGAKRLKATGATRMFMSAAADSIRWMEVNSRAARLIPIAPRGGLTVRYEDLARYPANVLQQVAGLFGMDVETSDIDTGAVVDQRHVVAGNRGGRPGPILILLDEKWITEMRPRQSALTTVLTAPGLIKYGYPLKPARYGS